MTQRALRLAFVQLEARELLVIELLLAPQPAVVARVERAHDVGLLERRKRTPDVVVLARHDLAPRGA